MGSDRGVPVFDLAIVGAGAAGMYCAALAGARGARVILIDHAPRLAEKIRISGGGRCNFTNLSAANPSCYLSDDPRFARFALTEHGPQAFIDRVMAYRIGFHEKHRGQLFCDESAEQIIAMLVSLCDQARVSWRRPVSVRSVHQESDRFCLGTDDEVIKAKRLVVATGGLPVPKIGATDWGLTLARRMGLAVIEPRPALVPLTFAPAQWEPLTSLAGVALEVEIAVAASEPSGAALSPVAKGSLRQVPKVAFTEDLLFTHRGLSGPAVLQASSYWNLGDALQINLTPGQDLTRQLLAAKHGGRRAVGTVLADHLPRRLVHEGFAPILQCDGALAGSRIADQSDRVLRDLATGLQTWRLVPSGTEGWRKAEVMRGGVATSELHPRTMEARRVPGLHFIGEVVDVTGWLGGYNFQWAWSSAAACAMAVTSDWDSRTAA